MEYPLINKVTKQNTQKYQQMIVLDPFTLLNRGEISPDQVEKKCDWTGYILKQELTTKAIVSEEKTKLLKPRKRRYIKKGHWSIDECAKYYLFLISNLNNFKTAHLRRLQKIFKQMSLFLGSRTPTQCRSHHQKQQKKYHCLSYILQNLYSEVKVHPLLSGQIPFDKNNPEYAHAFEGEVKPEKIANKVMEFETVQKVQKKGPLICYEMPEGLYPISKQRYISMFYQEYSHTISWLY